MTSEDEIAKLCAESASDQAEHLTDRGTAFLTSAGCERAWVRDRRFSVIVPELLAWAQRAEARSDEHYNQKVNCALEVAGLRVQLAGLWCRLDEMTVARDKACTLASSTAIIGMRNEDDRREVIREADALRAVGKST